MGRPVFLVEFAAKVWPRFLRSGAPDANGSRYQGRALLPIDPAVTYKVEGVARRSSSANGQLYIGVAFFNAAGSLFNFSWFAALNPVETEAWSRYSGTFGATGGTIPAGAVAMTPAVQLNFASTLGTQDCSECWIANNAAPSVPISVDPKMRDASQWAQTLGTAGTWLTEVDGTPQTLSLRYSTGAYITAAGDTPANTPYEARVLSPGLYRAEMPPEMCGPISTNVGEIVLSNADGALSAMSYAGLSGQVVSVWMGLEDASRSAFSELLRASIEQAVVDQSRVRLRLRGPDTLLKRPVLTNYYAGSNALPAGLEGTADDIKGAPKPRLYGTVRNISPPCVNTSRNIYQVHDCIAPRAPHSATEGIAVTAVRVRGLALSAGADYADQAAMESTAPSAGQYRVWPAGGYIRLGTAPTGQVTCDAYRVMGSPGEPREFGFMFTELAADAGLLSVRAGIDAILGPAYMGFWVNNAATTYEHAFTQLATSIGAWYGYAHWAGLPGSQYEFGAQIYPRGGDPYEWASFDASNILQMSGVAPPIAGRGRPFWRVDLGYWPNHNPTAADIDSTVTQAVRAQLASEGKRVGSTAASTLEMDAQAGTLLRETVLADDETAAQGESNRLLALLKRQKPCYQVVVPLQAALDQAVRPRLGGLVRLRHQNLQSLSVGGDGPDYVECLVLAIELDLARQTIALTLFQSPDDL